MIEQLEEFKSLEKYTGEDPFYNGVQDPVLRSTLSALSNKTADLFIEVALSENPTDDDYREALREGLSLFPTDLDTEDREQVCNYMEQMMDMVGLASSGGLLNSFMYGFDPTDR